MEQSLNDAIQEPRGIPAPEAQVYQPEFQGQLERRKRTPTRIDFALITLTGNRTRYEIVRPLVDAMPRVSARWYPIRTWVPGDWTHVLPGLTRIRLRHFLDSWRFLFRPSADAAVIHAFETYPLYVLFHRIGHRSRRPVIVLWPDGGIEKPSFLMRIAVRRTDLFLPWSQSSLASSLKSYPYIPTERIAVLHPGIDLAKWPLRPTPEPSADGRFRLLFVGADLMRKGVDTLLKAFEDQCGGLSETCVLDLCTQSGYLHDAPGLRERIERAPGVRLHLDLGHTDAEFRRLYANADAFTLPTTGEGSPWVALEAQASGVPVIITPVGSIPEIVTDGETGLLIPPNDSRALVDAVNRLRSDPELRTRIVRQARTQVEHHFDAQRQVMRLLDMVDKLVASR